MKHPKVNALKLAQRLTKAVGSTPVTEIARRANIDVSRVTRFLNGDFKKMTPVLSRLCAKFKIPVQDFLLESAPRTLSPEILHSLERIVGNDTKRGFAAIRLIRSLEVLARGQPQKNSKKRKD